MYLQMTGMDLNQLQSQIALWQLEVKSDLMLALKSSKLKKLEVADERS